MAHTAGMRTQDLYTSLFPRDVKEAIFNYKPWQTPISQFMLSSKNAVRKVYNPKFEIQEDVLMGHIDTASSAGGASGTAITAGTSNMWKAGDIMRNTVANENIRILTASTTSLTGVNVEGSTFSAIAAGTPVIRLAPAYAEGSVAAAARTTVSTFPYNYTQIRKKAVHLSGTQNAMAAYGGKDWTNQRVKATEEWKNEGEETYVYGIRAVDTTASANVFYSGGLLDSGGIGISDRSQFTGSGFATETYFFNTYLKTLFAKGSGEKILYCGADAVIGINDFSRVKQQTKVAESEYGYDVQRIITPFGRATIVWHPILESAYANWVIGVDREGYMKTAVLRPIEWQDDISTAGTDERKAQYLAEFGLDFAGGGQGVHNVLYPGA